VKLIYLGAEVPSNRKLLIDSHVNAFGFSYTRALKRGFPKTKEFSFWDYFPEGSLIVVHPGLTESVDGDLEQLAADYQDFVVTHLDDLAGFVEFNHADLGPRWRDEQRKFFQQAGPKFWPVWDGRGTPANLQQLASDYSEVAISSSAIESDSSLAAMTRSLSGIFSTTWHALSISRPDNLRQIPFATASTQSWASPMMRGETIVWDGTSLKRYQKKQKDQARRRYKAVVERAGLDYEAIVADDAKEVTRLAIWSYQQLEDSVSKRDGRPPLFVVGEEEPSNELITVDVPDAEIAEMLSGEVGNRDAEVRKPSSRIPAPRDLSEQGILPVVGVTTKTLVETDESGRPVIREAPVIESTGASLRQCNTCFVAANCPAFKPSSACAFSLPVEIKTKDQLMALLTTIIEMQSARVAFARYAEELNGGYPDPNTSQEMDRLFKLVEQLKKMEDNREFVKMTFERQGGGGVLSAIFGDRATQLRELENGGLDESAATRIIQQAIED
jgi:hypothetical protein